MRLFVMQGVETVSLSGRVSQIFARYNPDHTETVWVCDSVWHYKAHPDTQIGFEKQIYSLGVPAVEAEEAETDGEPPR